MGIKVLKNIILYFIKICSICLCIQRIRLLIQYCSLLNINNDYSRIQGLLRFFFNNLNFQLDKRSLEISNFKSKNIVDNLLEEGVIIRRRMAAGLSQLCSTCSIAIRDSNFYNDFVIKVKSILIL
jgi:hypothetical protein